MACTTPRRCNTGERRTSANPLQAGLQAKAKRLASRTHTKLPAPHGGHTHKGGARTGRLRWGPMARAKAPAQPLCLSVGEPNTRHATSLAHSPHPQGRCSRRGAQGAAMRPGLRTACSCRAGCADLLSRTTYGPVASDQVARAIANVGSRRAPDCCGDQPHCKKTRLVTRLITGLTTVTPLRSSLRACNTANS